MSRNSSYSIIGKIFAGKCNGDQINPLFLNVSSDTCDEDTSPPSSSVDKQNEHSQPPLSVTKEDYVFLSSGVRYYPHTTDYINGTPECSGVF